MPACRDTTAPISSSVWRLPFISASTRPAVTSSTAFAAESLLCSDVTISIAEMSRPASSARLGCALPDRPGSARSECSRAASTAPSSETSSQGCAMATLIVVSVCAALIRRSYLSCATVAGRSAVSGMGRLRLDGLLRTRHRTVLRPASGVVCPRPTARHARPGPDAGRRVPPYVLDIIAAQQPRQSTRPRVLRRAERADIAPAISP